MENFQTYGPTWSKEISKLTKKEIVEMLAKKGEECEQLTEVLFDAGLQLDYLQNKFQETGTGNSVISRIEKVIYLRVKGMSSKHPRMEALVNPSTH